VATTDEQHWQVGRLARATGLTVRTLHHYDKLGLLVPSERTFAGYRLYGEGDVRRLYRIVALRRLGLSLDAIGALLNGRELDLADLLGRQLDEVERQITQAGALRRRLTAIRDGLSSDVEPSIDQLIDTMEAITMYEKYYTTDQLERLERRREEVGEEAIAEAERGWAEVFATVRSEMDAGTDPRDPRLDSCRQRVRELLEAITGGEADMRASMNEMWSNEEPETLTRGMVDRELRDYYTRMFKAPDAERGGGS
jgi:DNA-binding transcriptional MerR regulator